MNRPYFTSHFSFFIIRKLMHLFHSKITIELWNQEREGEFHSRTYSLPPTDPGIMQTKDIFFGYNS